jgi:hypothetical protein
MDPQVVAKIETAFLPLVQGGDKLVHVLTHGPKAHKFWAAQVTENQKLDATGKQKLGTVKAQLPAVLSAAKQVRKDIVAFEKDIRELSKYKGTPKEFREKVAAKRLASAKAFEPVADRFVRGMTTLRPDGYYPGSAQLKPNADAVSTVNSLKAFLTAYRKFQIELVKL